MNVRDLVRSAWQVTQVNLRRLIWYGAVPAFFTTLVSSAYLAYQYNAFQHSAVLHPGEETFSPGGEVATVWGLVSTYPKAAIALTLTGILVFAGYTIIPPIFRAALIHALLKIRSEEPTTGSFEVGLRRFFPMFEFGLLSGSFGILTVFTESSFVLRWWGERVFFFILPMFLFIAMVGLIASFLFTYAEFYIVIEDKAVTRSIIESVVLVLSNLRKTLLVFLLMLLISARLILNVVVILLIPMGVVALVGYVASTFLSTVGLVLIVILGVSALLVASYVMGLFNVFSAAVWVFTYVLLSEKEAKPIKDVDLGK